MKKGKTNLCYYHLHKFDKEYERIMKLADRECPPQQYLTEKKSGRVKKGKERSLIERLMTLKNEVCMFVHNFQVPFDNNQAERDLRNVKTKNKVSVVIAQNYLEIMSFLNTGLKQGIGVVESLSATFVGNGNIVIH